MNKSEKVGITISILLLIIYAGFLVWFLYFGWYINIKEAIYLSTMNNFLKLITIILFLIGVYGISLGYGKIICKLFMPDNELDKRIKKLKHNFRNGKRELNKRIEIETLKYNLNKLQK